ncbi:hypothetical protein [Methylomonas koyamae]|uniref:hypothetical protein n=1 Tax=Methylomonas koyamae TaxID=702114 RepID=UPI0007C8F279|nr:hypothetical protein [Methylomonas koyamae]ATG89878.1 hypothetical protein MKLM6_1638 [Methylomonas koyamae]
MARICRDISERIEETRVEAQERIEKFERTVSESFCHDLPWPLDSICDVVTKIITEFVKVVVNVVVTIVRYVTRTVCDVVVSILNAAAFLIGLVYSIPFFGPLIRAGFRTIGELWSQFIGLFDAGLRLVGIRITKYLRICIIILEEENHQHVVEPDEMNSAIEFAKRAFYDGAKIRLRVLGFHKVNSPSPHDNLDVNAEGGAVWDELFTPGSWFETAANGYCFDEAIFRLVTIGAPVIVFVTRSVRGQVTGCSLGTFTDYVTVERGTFRGRSADPTVMAHEIAHACNLLHVDDQNNLMNPTSSAGSLRGSTITAGQSTLLRNSRHVTFI